MIVLLLSVAAVSLVVAVVLVGTPAVIGPVLETQVREAVSQADANALYNVSVESYDRSLFGADGQLKVSLGEAYIDMVEASIRADMDRAQADPEVAEAAIAQTRAYFSMPLTVDFEASHGIVTRLDGARLGLTTIRLSADPALGPDGSFVDMLGADGPIEGLVHVTVNGDIEFSAEIPAGALTESDQSIEFSPGLMNGHFDRSDGRVVATLRMDEMAMKAGLDSGSMRGLSARYDMQQFDGPLWIGSGQMDVASLTVDISDPDAPAGLQQPYFNIDRFALTMDSHVDPDGETMSVTVEYAVESFFNSMASASGSLSMPITFSSLDLGAMKAYAQLAAGAPLKLMNQAGDELRERLIPIAESLLQHSPAMRIGPARVEYNEEVLNLDIGIAVDGEEFQQAGFEGLAQLSALGTLVTGSAEFDITRGLAEEIAEQVLAERIAASMSAQAPEDRPTDEQLAEFARQQVPMILGQLAAQQLIVETDIGYESSLALQSDGVSLNGMTIPLQMLLQ